jgi:hypothetical protein
MAFLLCLCYVTNALGLNRLPHGTGNVQNKCGIMCGLYLIKFVWCVLVVDLGLTNFVTSILVTERMYFRSFKINSTD